MTDQLSQPSGQGISRRDLLHGASVGIAASAAASLLPTFGHSQRPGQPTSSPVQAKPATLTPASMPKGFAKEEYPWRWQRVRALMKERNLDCLLAPAGTQDYPDEPDDVTYLTGGGGGWVVFPYDGKVTAILARGDASGENEAGVELRPDGRYPGILVSSNAEAGQWSPALINILREKGLTGGRIGVVNLSGVPRNDEGTVSYTTLDRVIKALPRARFESATDVMIKAKVVRTPAEIAVMEKADEVAEAGIKVLLENARPAVSLRELYFNMHEAMRAASGETGSIAFSVGGGGGGSSRMLGSYSEPRLGPPPAERLLPSGQMMREEVSGQVLGYRMQVMHAVYLGPRAPQEWNAAAEYCIECFGKLLDFMRPGVTMKELNDFYVSLLKAKGLEYDKDDSNVIFHMGDGPRMGPNRKEGKDLVLEENWVFHTVKPMVPFGPNPSTVHARNTATYAQFGDGVLVTANGSRRLGKRKLEVLSLGA
ncbi:MAG: M24 family metallopeptidase [Acidobacteriota bacterium]